jgi:electron transport complex protein RnfC
MMFGFNLVEALRGLAQGPLIRGGVHPQGHKSPTADKPINLSFPLPLKLYIPLQQHVGQPAEPAVQVGQRVRRGELLANSQGMISAPVHAPTSGVIKDVTEYPAPHPSALPIRTIILETDGEDEAPEPQRLPDPFGMDPKEIAVRVGAAGIVGMGGAAFPSAVKLDLGRKNNIHTLFINGGECEPYLTCDDRLMRERAEEIVDGVRIMLHGLKAPRAVIVLEDNKPDAYSAMHEAAKAFDAVEVVQVPTHYPMGWDRQMFRYILGKEVPADGRATDLGVLMHNVATAYSVHRALRFGEPLIRRIVTISGGAVARPMNVEAPLGTLLSELLRFCGCDPADAARLIIGGPMMGEALPHAGVPLVKGVNGLLALTAAEVAQREPQPCIRCSRCVTACPVGLLPLEMAGRIKAGKLDSAVDYGLKDCISCGSCSYVCPSEIPLVHYFKYAKDSLVAQQKAEHKAEQTKKLVAARQDRLERMRKARDEEDDD